MDMLLRLAVAGFILRKFGGGFDDIFIIYAHNRATVTQGFPVYWEPQQQSVQGMRKRLLLGAAILLAEAQGIVVK